MRHARAGDVIMVHTLDPFGRTVRDTLSLVHELKEGERTNWQPDIWGLVGVWPCSLEVSSGWARFRPIEAMGI